MEDSLPDILRDLSATLDAELTGNPLAAVELDADARAALVSLSARPTPAKAAVAAAGAKPAAPSIAVTVTQPPAPPPMPPEKPAPVPPADADLPAIAAAIASCEACELCRARNRTVPGVGRLNPDVMFIGEGPGADEDAKGLPFVGRAGELLTKMIAAMGYAREEVFIANVVKCRPPDNRKPTPQEMAACMPFLRRQIAIVKPRFIVALGATAVQGLFNTKQGINALRGKWMDLGGIPVMPTYHPAYLLRMPSVKREAWADLRQVMAKLGRL